MQLRLVMVALGDVRAVKGASAFSYGSVKRRPSNKITSVFSYGSIRRRPISAKGLSNKKRPVRLATMKKYTVVAEKP